MLDAAESYVPDERKPDAQAHLAAEGEGPRNPCDALTAIYESMYGKAPKHTIAASVLRACEKAGDADREERMASMELLNELRK